MASKARLVLLPLLLALLAGCAGVPTRIERPSLELVGVELKKADLTEQRFMLTFSVHNPNPVSIPVKGLSYALHMADREFAQGATAKSFTLAANGETRFQLEVNTRLFDSFRQMEKLLRARPEAVDYRVSGKLDVNLPFVSSFPFEDRGKVQLKLR